MQLVQADCGRLIGQRAHHVQLVQADCGRLIGPEGSACAACTGRLQAPDWARGLTGEQGGTLAY